MRFNKTASVHNPSSSWRNNYFNNSKFVTCFLPHLCYRICFQMYLPSCCYCPSPIRKVVGFTGARQYLRRQFAHYWQYYQYHWHRYSSKKWHIHRLETPCARRRADHPTHTGNDRPLPSHVLRHLCSNGIARLSCTGLSTSGKKPVICATKP